MWAEAKAIGAFGGDRELMDEGAPGAVALIGNRKRLLGVGEAIRYALRRWDGLARFLGYGRIDFDNNAVERAIRPLALNNKSVLFAGSEDGGDNWAVIATLIEKCILTGINPHTGLTATLTSLANGHPRSRTGELLPHAHVA